MRERIAVVGGGVAGIVASHILSNKYDVTIFEQNDYLGGHTNTVLISSGADKGLAVDTGFIVFNEQTYPNFMKFIDQLGVVIQDSDMSFGYFDEATGFHYAGTGIKGLFLSGKTP